MCGQHSCSSNGAKICMTKNNHNFRFGGAMPETLGRLMRTILQVVLFQQPPMISSDLLPYGSIFCRVTGIFMYKTNKRSLIKSDIGRDNILKCDLLTYSEEIPEQLPSFKILARKLRHLSSLSLFVRGLIPIESTPVLKVQNRTDIQ